MNDSNVAISDDCAFKLTANGSRLKKFEIEGDYPKSVINKMMLPKELSLQYKKDSNLALSDDCAFKLTRNSSILKTLGIVSDYKKTVISNMMLPYVAAHCTQLETLKVCHVNIPANALEILSNSCHQLKSIGLGYVTNHSGLDKLIKANVNLLSLPDSRN